jgi:hypothetical protein
MDAGSNLIWPRTVVPGLRAVLQKGETWMASIVFAVPAESAAYADWFTAWQSMRARKYDSVQAMALAVGIHLERQIDP